MFRSIFEILTGNVFSAIATYVSLLYLSANMTVVDYGGFTKFYYATGILFVIFDLGLSSSLVIGFSKKDRLFSIVDVITSYKYQYLICCIITSVVGFSLFSGETTLVLIIVAFLGLINKLMSIKFQIIERWIDSTKIIFSLTLTRSVLLVVFTYVLSKVHNVTVNSSDLEFVFLFATVASIIINLLYSYKKTKNITVNRLYKNELKSTSKYIYIGSILAIVCMRADVFLIDYFINSESSGEYAKVSIIFFVFPMVISSINSVLLRHYSSYEYEDSDPLRDKLKYIISSCLVIFTSVVFLIYNFHATLTKYLTQDMISVFVLLLLAYLGAIVSGSYESKIMANNQKYYMIIKLIQLLTLLLTFVASYNFLGLVAGALAFLLSRISGWVLICNYYVR